jgi:hypothetical protein
MTILERVFASAGAEVVIPTLELTCSAWSAPILLCNGWQDHTCVTEDGRTLTFAASGIQIALPRRDTAGTQVLTFAVDNVSGEAQQRIDQAIDAGQRVHLVFRHYVSTDLSAPAERPMRFVVREATMEGSAVQISAAFYDAINTAWPRTYYTASFAPGLRYFR